MVGFKPTTGLLPARDRAGLTVGGPIARAVEDVAAYARTVLGLESAALPGPPLRAAWSEGLGFCATDPRVARTARSAAQALADAGVIRWVRAPLRLRDPGDEWRHRRGGAPADPRTGARDRARLAALFDRADLLLTPTTPHPPHGHDGPGETMNVALTWAFNLTGHPALTVPAGPDEDGLPVGLQLVAAHHRDGLLIALAAEFERLRPWRTPPLSGFLPA